MGWFSRWRKGKRQGTNAPRGGFNFWGGRRYLDNVSYFLPKDDVEINRLDFQHYLLRYALRGNFAAPIVRPSSILDVGCGTGRWAMEMARAYPEANVIGIDLLPPPSEEHLRQLAATDPRPENYVYLQANALDGLPFPNDTFDFVHQRLLVAGIPVARWPDEVRDLLRVTRPGGWLELVEAIPASGGPAMNQLREWLVGVGLPRGVDIRTTHQISQYLQASGARNIEYRELNVQMGKGGGRVGMMMETNYFSLHAGIRGVALAQGLTTPEIFDATIQRAQQEIATGRYVWPYYLAYGQRPE
jgi:ubiquinone/menaquinone biosynthesis C-methylase UbiE